MTFQLIVYKISLVSASIAPLEESLTILFAIFVLPLKLCAVCPRFLSFSVLGIVFKITFVSCAIGVSHFAIALHLISHQFSVEDVTVAKSQSD